MVVTDIREDRTVDSRDSASRLEVDLYLRVIMSVDREVTAWVSLSLISVRLLIAGSVFVVCGTELRSTAL